MFDLKRFRKHHKLSQYDVAFLFECGQPNISAIENDGRDLTPEQWDILKEKYGDIDKYQSNSNSSDNNLFRDTEINFTSQENNTTDETDWISLVSKHQDTIERLIGLLEKEKEENLKLIETINLLTTAVVQKKAI